MISKKAQYHEFKELAVAYRKEDAAWERKLDEKSLEVCEDQYSLERETTPEDIANRDNIATAADIEARMIFQDRRFLELQALGDLSPQWKSYGMKRSSEINKAMGMRGKEH